ncbi:MAG: hypothetical protein ACREEM_10910 [Blastocatellia bacterium]
MQRQHMLKIVVEKISRLTISRKKKLITSSRFFSVLGAMALLLAPFTSLTPPMRHSARSQELGFSSLSNLPVHTSLTKTQRGPSKVYCPYWYLDRNTTSVLEVTNNAVVSLTVTPTLFLGGVERVPLDPVTIPSHATTRISLNRALSARTNDDPNPSRERRWGDGSRIGSKWGSATLQSESVESISGKILSENPQESLAVHSGFYEYGGRNLSSMWWLPTPNTVALYALQNASYSELRVSAILYSDGQVIAGRRLNLPASSSRLVDLRELLPDDVARRRLPEVGMVRFIVEGEASSLLGRAVLFDENRGFSVPLAMRDITAHSTVLLQMPGALFGRPDRGLGFPSGARFTTQLLLTNTSNKALNATITLDGKNAAGIPVSWNLPVIELAPLGSLAVDLDKARVQGRSPIADGHVGIRLTHTGTVLDLSAEAVTVDQTLRFSFDNEFYDNDLVARIYNAVSFNLTGNKNTLLLIKNSSNRVIQFGYKLNYERQGVVHSYKATLSRLKPYELRVVDIRSLRDSGVVDADGRVLPADVEFGNANIYSDQPIISGDPNYDPVAGISSSCIGPCGEFVPPYCDPCFLDPSLCQPTCTDTCTPCRENRNRLERLCYSALVACEAPFAANYSNCLNGCENMAFCRQSDPNYNLEECNRCKDGCLTTFLIATAGCGTVFGFCLSALPDCVEYPRYQTTTCGFCSN